MEFTGERFIPLDSLLDDEIAFEHLHRYHALRDIVKNKTVLDIASGEGYGTALLAKSAKKVFGVDIDPNAIEYSTKKYADAGNIEFIIGSADLIPLPDHSIDIVVSYETIEHLDESLQAKFLLEIKRVLKREGSLVISTPDKTNYSERYGYTNKFHLKEFTSEEFSSFLKNYFGHVIPYLQGYEIVSAITENEPKKVNNVQVSNWERSTKPFARKYLISICSDKPFEKNSGFSSVVFQVSKDFMQMTDRIVEMEAHILDLGTWGKKLDTEINERDRTIERQQKALFNETNSSSHLLALNSKLEEEKSRWLKTEIFLQETIQKQSDSILMISSHNAEREEELKLIKIELENELNFKQQLESDLQNKNNEINDLKKDAQSLEQSRLKQSEDIRVLRIDNKLSHEIVEELKKEVKDYESITKELRQQILLSNQQLNTINAKLTEIYDSDGWKFLKKYYKLKGWLLHEDSKRYRILKKIVNKIRGKKEIDKAPILISAPTLYENSHPEKLKPKDFSEAYKIIEFPIFEHPKVSIVIPAYNAWHMNYKCLCSIRQHAYGVSYEVIFADDQSTDETRNIKDYIKNITVIRNETNLGFLKNCNHAASFAKGDYIHFLNNDTEVTPGWLNSLSELMDRDEQIGMAGSKLVYPNGRLQEAGGIIWQDGSGWNYGHNQDPEAPEFNYLKEVDYVSGASIMVRKTVWQKLRGFDDSYSPAYCEDSDLAFEIRKMNMKVVYQPLSIVIHHEGFSHGSDNDKKAGLTNTKSVQKINTTKFADKWYSVLAKQFDNGINVFWARDRSQHKKTILVIDHYVPHFDKDAGSRTVFQYLKLFSSLNLNVKFIGDNFCRHEPYTTILQQMGIEVLYGSWYAANWQQWIKINHDKFDFIFLNRPHISIKYIDFIVENTKAKILYYGHDLHFIRERSQYEVEKDEELLTSAKKWEKTEKYIFSKSDIILAPSDDEKKIITNLIGEDKAKTILPYFFEKLNLPITDFSDRHRILFIGGFSHKPNVDAVIWFVREIWSRIKKVRNDLEFTIVGSNPPSEVLQLQAEAISIKGFVSDEELIELYGQTKISVIPLRYGAGVKGKTIEAIYHGVPIVTTSFGIEGLPGNHSFLKPKNTAGEFADEILDLYENEEKLKELSKQSIEYIDNNFSIKIAAGIISNVLTGEVNRKLYLI